MPNNNNNNVDKIKIIISIIIIVLILIKIITTKEPIIIEENNNYNLENSQEIVTQEENLQQVEDNQNEENNVQIEEHNNLQEDVNIVENKLGNTDLSIYYIYVGQADCILVKDENEVMMIDAGNNLDGKLICNYLKSLDIEKVDYLIGTHPHEDHIGGVDEIIYNFKVGHLYMPDRTTTLRTYTDIEKACEKRKVKIEVPKVGDKFKVGDATCEIMGIDSKAERLNDCSIVIELTYGENKFLFTGDMEELKEKERKWNDVDVLKVGHHGSYSSTSKAFLNQTKPEIAVIMVGKDNEYGYPHKETIQKLNNIKAKILRTDELGTIIMTSDGKNIEYNAINKSCDGD